MLVVDQTKLVYSNGLYIPHFICLKLLLKGNNLSRLLKGNGVHYPLQGHSTFYTTVCRYIQRKVPSHISTVWCVDICVPQFLSLQGAATSIIFVTANVLVMTKRLLSRQKYACHDKSFVITKLCSSQQNFCVDKHTFVVTKDVSCCDKHVFVTTESFSWQNFCHKHTSVATKDAFCHDKNYTCGSSHQGQISDTYSKDRYWSVRLTYEGDLETQLGSYSKDRYRSVRLTSEGHPGSTCWL